MLFSQATYTIWSALTESENTAWLRCGMQCYDMVAHKFSPIADGLLVSCLHWNLTLPRPNPHMVDIVEAHVDGLKYMFP